MKTFIISLGGSIVVPKLVDTEFLLKFKKAIFDYLNKNKNVRIILVVGGGWTARLYQNALKDIIKNPTIKQLDEIGIMATKLNAEYVKNVFELDNKVVNYPKNKNIKFSNNLVVASGWKPGFSTDTDAVYYALSNNAKVILNLSNIEKVYTADPKKDKNAKPIDKISWAEFRKIVGNKWSAGLNVPFDPIASRLAEKNNLKVICAAGSNIDNIINILSDRSYVGTLIH